MLHSKAVQWKYRHFFLRFQTEEHILGVNKSKVIGENTFMVNDFDIEGNHDSSKDKETLILVFLQICDQCFNS